MFCQTSSKLSLTLVVHFPIDVHTRIKENVKSPSHLEPEVRALWNDFAGVDVVNN